MNLAQWVIREPSIRDVPHYQKRVHALWLIFFLLFLLCWSGIAIILLRVKLFVTLAQRSNVETLTLAFLLLFFFYVGILSAPGAWGALKLLWFRAVLRWKGREHAERMRSRWLGQPRSEEGPVVAFNVAIEKEGAPKEALIIPIRDRIGSMGSLLIRGARVEHREALRDGTHSLFSFFEQRLARVLKKRDEELSIIPDIVEWKKLDDEETEKYLCLVHFAQRLERHLGARELWPTLTLKASEIAQLESELSELCPALRDEALLPHWEYSGEHKLPIIPEPLGIISLSRNEKRVDPLTSMGAALTMVIAALAILLALAWRPPWVPGI